MLLINLHLIQRFYLWVIPSVVGSLLLVFFLCVSTRGWECVHKHVRSLKLMSGIMFLPYTLSQDLSINSELAATVASLANLASFIASVLRLCLPRFGVPVGHRARLESARGFWCLISSLSLHGKGFTFNC